MSLRRSGIPAAPSLRWTFFVAAAAFSSIAAALSGCASGPAATNQETGRLVISNPSLDFGTVQVGSTASASISLSNGGSAALQITKIAVAGASFSLDGASPAPVTIDAGYAYSVAVQFAPSAAGAETGTLTITASSSPTPVSVALSGTGQAKQTGPELTLTTTSLSFGDVELNTPETQTVSVTSSGTAPLVVSAATLTGAGFTFSGDTFPITLDPAQSATLSVVFDPAAAGAVAGTLTVTSNAGTAAVALSGTGETAAREVNLSWDPPSNSADAAVGYNVYREVAGAGTYQLLNDGLLAATSYTDTLVEAGFTYNYYIVSVDAAGTMSAPSNVFTITVPQ